MALISGVRGSGPRQRGEGWTAVTIADSTTFGTSGMVARHVALVPNATFSLELPVEVDAFLYVIRGAGRAAVPGRSVPIEEETVVWLEPGDAWQLEAGPEGLEMLLAYAPGG